MLDYRGVDCIQFAAGPGRSQSIIDLSRRGPCCYETRKHRHVVRYRLQLGQEVCRWRRWERGYFLNGNLIGSANASDHSEIGGCWQI